MKVCADCQALLPLEAFRPARASLRSYCRACEYTRLKDYRRRNPEAYLKSQRATDHRRRLKARGLTAEQFDAMLADQGGKCLICSAPDGELSRLCIDHDHKTEKPRGLLCHTCNRALGLFDDSAERLRAAAAYLEHHTNHGDNHEL